MSRAVIVILITAFVFISASSVNAQSALERAFVAKSRLVSKIWTRHDPNSMTEINHDAWDRFLGKYVQPDAAGVNRVAYGLVSALDKDALQGYLDALQAVDPGLLNRDEQYAYWLNLYNATTVATILKHYPVESILDIKSNLLDFKGPFNDRLVKVNGHALSLDTIESGIVRPIWNDPLLHYAFNCAAVSCPNLSARGLPGKHYPRTASRCRNFLCQ